MSRTTIVAVLCTLMASQGCSIYYAAKAPGPVNVQEVQTGKDRSQIISVLGMPKSTETLNGERTDMHEFTSGYDPGSKLRILFYVAGDFFTLGLAELIFWPLEVAALQGDEGRAVIGYDQNNIAKTVLVTTKGGAPWVQNVSTKNGGESDPAVENMTAYDLEIYR